MRNNVWKVLLLSLALVALLAAPSHAIKVGDDAEPFSLLNPLTNGKQDFDPKKLKNPVLLVYFNTTCGACDSEINFLKGVSEEMPGKFDIYLIAVDGTPDAKQKITGYVTAKGIKATTLWDKEFDTGEKYGFTFSPATVGIGKDGKVRFLKPGFGREDRAALKAKIEEMLK